MKKIFVTLLLLLSTTLSLSAYTVDDIPNGYFSSNGYMCDTCTNNRTDIRYLQVLLNADDRLSVSLTEDGYWGNNTKNAVKSFQREYGLSLIDGHVGNGTKSQLDIVLSRLKGSSNVVPSKPAHVTASNDAYVGKIRVSSYSTSGATSYQIYRATSSSKSSMSRIKTTSSTSYYDRSSSLQEGRKYYYRVKACNDNGCSDLSNEYDWGRVKTQSVSKPPKPTLTSPGILATTGELITDKTPRLRWNTASRATYYNVAMRDINTGSLVLNKTNVTSTSLTTSTLTAGHKYYWDITACNSAGCGEWSDSLYFKIEDDSSSNAPSIENINPNELEIKSMQYIEIHGDDFDEGCKIHWRTSSGSSSIINSNYIIRLGSGYAKFKLYGVNNNSTYWEFKVVNSDGKESSWIKANVSSNNNGSQANFLHHPLSGTTPPRNNIYKHSNAPISSIYDHSSIFGTITAFDNQVAKRSYGSSGNCYKVYSRVDVKFKGLFYKGSGGKSQYLCYDKSGGGQHKGWDYAIGTGTPVFAAADGKVSYANWENASNHNQGFGKYVSIHHGEDYKTYYGHLNSLSVSVGTNVRKGDLIGYSGNTGSSTGPHLHFEVRKNCGYIATGCSAIDPFTTNKDTDLWADWSYNDNSEENMELNIHTELSNYKYGGLTIITHGLNSDTNDWVQEMGLSIFNKIDNNDKVTVKIMTITANKQDIILNDPYYMGDIFKEPTSSVSSAKNLILLLDWGDNASIFDPTSDFGDTEHVIAKMAVEKILTTDYKKFVAMPIHIIGHSRGGSVASFIAKEFSARGVTIDQLTMLDPHPMNHVADLDSEAPNIFGNVLYTDTYYQNSGGNGIIGYCQKDYSDCNNITSFLQLNSGYIANDRTMHSKVHAYYFTTILDNRQNLNQYNYYKDHASFRWFLTEEDRKNMGFSKTRHKHGVLNRLLDGLNNDYYSYLGLPENNNIGKRNNDDIMIDLSQPIYPNVIFESNLLGNIIDIVNKEDKTVEVNVITDTYPKEYSDSLYKVQLYLDNNKNPFDGFERILKTSYVPKTITTYLNITNKIKFNIPKSDIENLTSGSYYICVAITNTKNNLSRYDYHMSKFIVNKKITEPEQLQNRAPMRPHISVYTNKVVDGYPTVGVQTSIFNDPDTGDTHWKTWWGIKKSSGYIWHSTWRTDNKTEFELPNILEFDTTYTVDVRHMDNYGKWSEYDSVTFRTQEAPKPTIEVQTATNITQNGATVWSIYNTHGLSNTKTNISWGETSSLGYNTISRTIGVNESGRDHRFEHLECGTTYYYQANISNTRGSSESDMKNFTTLPCGPKVSITASEGKANIEEYDEVSIGECMTRKISLTKQNDLGTASGSVEILQDTDGAFSLKGSSSFSLSNRQDRKEFEVEFCPMEKKTYTAVLHATAENVSFTSNRVNVALIGTGADGGSNGFSGDLYLSNATVDKTTLQAGESLTARVIQNYSGSNAESKKVYVGYYLSTDTTWDVNDIKLDSDYSTLSASDLEDDEVETLTIRPETQAGNYYVLFVTDYKKQYEETDENNNVMFKAITITENIQNDFSISSFSISKTKIKYNDTFDIDIIYEYAGNSADILNPKATMYISKDNIIDSNDKKYFEVYGGINLSSSNIVSSKVYHTRAYVNVPAGDYYLLMKINDPSKYNESNYNNNIMSVAITILGELDTDNDGIPDSEDEDDDNDGYYDGIDAFPLNPREWLDTDNDGTGNNADRDDDNDGISDADEIKWGFDPLDPSDGGNADADNDGVSNADEIEAGSDPLDPDDTKKPKRFVPIMMDDMVILVPLEE